MNPGSIVPRNEINALAIARMSANHPHFPTLPASAKELIAPIGLESRHANSSRHVNSLENLSGLRVDSPQITLAAFRRAVPQLPIDPRHAGNESIRFDRAKNRPRLGIDLMNLPAAILTHP